jgi:3-isopropylmalate/(R)-2-methylmalate dehydratase small subunit
MKAFKTFNAKAAYLDRPNVDTDLIIPKQFLKSTSRQGYGSHLFNDLRFLPDGGENPEFVLNKPRFKGAGVLVGRENFGCGSSREHAAWAIFDYGFKTVIAPSFGDIFKNNSSNVGLLLIELPEEVVSDLIQRIEANNNFQLKVDLKNQILKGSDGWEQDFRTDPFVKEKFLRGGSEIDLTLRKRKKKITSYEKSHKKPWQAVLPDPAPEPEPDDDDE